MRTTTIQRSLFAASLLFLALHGGAAPPSMGVAPPAPPALEQGQVVTLYAHDDLTSSFSFRSGGPGAQVAGGEIDLSNAQMAFHVFEPDRISFGFVRDELVNIIDLGDFFVPPIAQAQDPASKFSISLFQTLFMAGGSQFSYLGPRGQTLRLKDADRILDPLPKRQIHHIEPKVGHTYLLRAQIRGERSSEVFAKFEVIGYLPGHSMTMRWEGLSG